MHEALYDHQICIAWKEAEAELHIRVAAPFVLIMDGREVAFEALIDDFGGPMGTEAVASETARFRPSLQRLGYFVSQLFPSYRVYSREHFTATLGLIWSLRLYTAVVHGQAMVVAITG